jgi:hypothetical protein
MNGREALESSGSYSPQKKAEDMTAPTISATPKNNP